MLCGLKEEEKIISIRTETFPNDSRFFSESPSDVSSVLTRSMCVWRSLSQCVNCLLSVLIITSCSSICFACCSRRAVVFGSFITEPLTEWPTDVIGDSGWESRDDEEASPDELWDDVLTVASPFARGAGGGGTDGGGVGGGNFMAGKPARGYDKFRSGTGRPLGGDELRARTCA